MNRLDHLRRTLEYNGWANAQVLGAMQSTTDVPLKAVRIFAHVIGAERLWHARIVGGELPEVWPEMTISLCESALSDLIRHWHQWSMSLTDDDLDRPTEYVNSRGEPWTSTIGDIIAHVTHHASYHRGQIATLLGEGGHASPYTDYIHAARQRFI